MDRRAKLLGLDQPKLIDITSAIERAAAEAGIDVEQALRDAREIVKRAGL